MSHKPLGSWPNQFLCWRSCIWRTQLDTDFSTWSHLFSSPFSPHSIYFQSFLLPLIYILLTTVVIHFIYVHSQSIILIIVNNHRKHTQMLPVYILHGIKMVCYINLDANILLSGMVMQLNPFFYNLYNKKSKL